MQVIGGIMFWGVNTPNPDGWIDMDGANNHVIADDPDLAELLGTDYGAGWNALTQYAMPNSAGIDVSQSQLKLIICKSAS